MEELGLGGTQLAGARGELLAADLVAYRAPLYQVLALSRRPAAAVVEVGGVGAGGEAERGLTPAEVRALIEATFGAVDR
jgi:hypothetical protein